MRIFKKRGKYWLDYWVGGRRIRKPISKLKSEAEKVKTQIESDILHGKYSIPSNKKIKFVEFAKIYLERYALPIHKSIKSTISRIKNLNSFFADFYLNEITSYLVEEYRKVRLSALVRNGKPISRSTINREFQVLTTMINIAIQWGYLSHSPFNKIKKFPESPKERILVNEEIAGLVSQAKSPLKEIILVALNTGMRLGEILSLEFTHVNLDGQFISIGKTKTDRPRKIPMNEALVELFSHLTLKRDSRKYVFENPRTGKPIMSIKTSFSNLLKKLKIQNLRFHDLRHTFATYSLMNGCDIFHLSQILGHTDVSTTMRYLSVKTEGLQKVVNSFVVKDPEGNLTKIQSEQGEKHGVL